MSYATMPQYAGRTLGPGTLPALRQNLPRRPRAGHGLAGSLGRGRRRYDRSGSAATAARAALLRSVSTAPDRPPRFGTVMTSRPAPPFPGGSPAPRNRV